MYQLVFRGECVPGTDEQTARDNARALFKATLDQVERMFSGKRVVIRNKLDQAQADKYEAVMRKHGMIVHVEPMGDASGVASPKSEPAGASPKVAPQPKSVPEAAPQAPDSSAAGVPKGVTASDSVPVEPGDRLPVAGEKVDAILAGSGLKVDAIHERLSESHETEAPLFEHLDDWTIAPAGTILTEPHEDIPPVVPDISHLSLADSEDDRK